MKAIGFLAILSPTALGFILPPQLLNLIISVVIAVIVHFTSSGSRRGNKHRDDYDSN